MVELPKVSFNNSKLLPLSDLRERVLRYCPQMFSILSNSYGSILHAHLLTTAPARIISSIFVEPVCFYPYIGQLLRFTQLGPRVIWQRRWTRESFLLLLSYLLVSSDLDVLHACSRLQTEACWEAEELLDERSLLIFSENDYLIDSARLLTYFQRLRPSVRTRLVKNSRHGEALFLIAQSDPDLL